ncbi:MAG: hypothetical protein AAB339_08625 [Elusimicrobiota bacterium]
MKEVIGLIAGSGRFPILFAKEARRQGFTIAAAISFPEGFKQSPAAVEFCQNTIQIRHAFF